MATLYLVERLDFMECDKHKKQHCLLSLVAMMTIKLCKRIHDVRPVFTPQTFLGLTPRFGTKGPEKSGENCLIRVICL